MASIIDGKAAAAALRARLAGDARDLQQKHGIAPCLKVILVGDHPASAAYVRTKAKMAAEVGIEGEIVRLPETTTAEELHAVIRGLNADPAVHGILVQLPLPDHIPEAPILDLVDPAKDVDGFHPLNVGRLFSTARPQEAGLLLPCTPLGCLILLQSTLGADGLAGKRAVVVGRSNIVGKPMAALLLAADCTVTIAHSRTRDLPGLCREAEILVAAVGRPAMVKGEWVRPGATVIDVGINRIQGDDGKSRLVGDVEFEPAAERAGAITPVPGGVGPMTVACLMRNTIIAAGMQAGVTPSGA